MNYKCTVPEGQSGDWAVERFEITEKQSDWAGTLAVIGALQGDPFRGRIEAGEYTRLMHGGSVVMSDSPDEFRDHREPVAMARKLGGRCLVNGLGLGIVADMMLEAGAEHVTVIEKDPDVIRLVAPHLFAEWGGFTPGVHSLESGGSAHSYSVSERLTIVCADALEWRPPKGERYTVVWHDIWPTISSENLPEMHKLHRRYGRRCDWQGSWARELCEDTRKRDKEWVL